MIQEFLIKVAADYMLIVLVFIGAYALIFKIPKRKRFKAYCRILVAGLTAYLLAKLVGSIFQPEALRPFEMIGKAAGASYLNNAGFPSDHVLFAAAITCAVWFETKQKTLTWILAVMVVIIGVGRVLALVHTPLDVIGGVVFALFGALWYLNSKE